MNDAIKRISLDLQDSKSSVSVNVKQSDTGRSLYISLVDGGVPYQLTEDCTVVFRATKPDGNIVYNDCSIENGVVRYTITNQTIALPGVIKCELTITSSLKQLTSPTFYLYADTRIYSDSEVESSNEYTALTSATTNAAQAAEAANKAAADLLEMAENGEFDGPKGDKGDPGYTPVKGVDYFDGKDGKNGADGEDGYTPVRGTDYYTESEKAELVQEVTASVNNEIGLSLDSIIALQESYIGGDAV